MPRTRRQWSALRTEIRRLLRETDSSTSYWSDALLLDLANQCLDRLFMQLVNADEGWLTSEETQDILEDTREYAIPEGVGRLKRVVIVRDEGGDYEVPLARDEKWGSAVHHSDSASLNHGAYPTYRIVGNNVVLEPKPRETITDGLRLEGEAAPPRLTGDSSTLAAGLPTDVMETVLIYDVVVAALAVEASQGDLPETYVNHLVTHKAAIDAQWRDYIERRSAGRVFGQPFRLGD